MIDELGIWAAQDALVALLKAHVAFDAGGADEIPVSLGYPSSGLQPQHAWVDAGGSGTLTSAVTGNAPSDETYRFKVFLFATGDDVAAARTKVQAMAAAVEDCLESDEFAAVADAWTVPTWTLDSGTDGEAQQLCLEETVECRRW